MGRALPTTFNSVMCADEASHRFTTAQSAVDAVNAAALVSIEGLGDDIRVYFRTGSQYYIPKNRDQRRTQYPNHYGSFPHAPGEKQMVLRQPFHHAGGSQIPTTIAASGSPGGANLAVLPPRSMDSTHQTIVQEGEPDPSARSGESVLQYKFPPTQGSSSPNGNAGQVSSQQYQQGRRLSASLPHRPSRDDSRHPSTLPRNFVPPGQPGYGGFPKGAIPTGYPPPPMPFTPRVAPGSPTPAPRSSANNDGEGTIDYGTVRIRPGKAKYMAIPPDWRRESMSLQPVDEAASGAPLPSTHDSQIPTTDREDSSHLLNISNGQQVQATEGGQGDNTGQPHSERREEVVSSSHPALDALHDSNIHAKRKAHETEKDNETFGQTWPKKKLAQVAQPDKSEKGSPTSRSEHQYLEGQAEGHGSPKFEENTNENANENHQEPDLQPSTTRDGSFAAGPPEVQNFEPTIAASQFPAYPKETVQEAGQHTTGLNVSDTTSTSVSICKPVAHVTSPQFRRSEPFPTYRDLMSGNRSPKKDQKNMISGCDDNKPASSDTSIVQKNVGKSLKKLNPGAENFVPPSRDPSSLDSTSMPMNQTSSLPASLHSDSPTAPVASQFQPQIQPFGHQTPLQLEDRANAQMVYMPTITNVAVVPSANVQLSYPHGSNNGHRMLECHGNSLSGQYHHSLPQVTDPDGNGRIMSHGKYKGRPGGSKYRKNKYWGRNRFLANRNVEGSSPGDESNKSKGSGKEGSSGSERGLAGDNGKGACTGSASGSAPTSASTTPAAETKAAKNYNNKRRNQDKSMNTKRSDDQNNATASPESTNKSKRKGRNFTTKHQKYKEPEKEKEKEKEKDSAAATATGPSSSNSQQSLADDFPALPPPPVATSSSHAAAPTADPLKLDPNTKAKNKPA
jgi:hypothetical protein